LCELLADFGVLRVLEYFYVSHKQLVHTQDNAIPVTG